MLKREIKEAGIAGLSVFGLCVLICYGIGVAIHWEIDPSHWERGARTALSVIGGLGGTIFGVILGLAWIDTRHLFIEDESK